MTNLTRKLRKIALWTAASLAGLTAVAVATVATFERRTFDVPYPSIAARTDAATIARGRYLAYGPAHCVDCHATPGARPGPDGELPLAGGHELKLPVGIFRGRNLTPDRETGLGAVSDAAIARALRNGVDHRGRALAPFMPFADLSDDDLVAVISYLRTQKPVRNVVEPRSLNPLGHVVAAFMIGPTTPKHTPPAAAPTGPSIERGRYLAESVANCRGCHTERDLRTGAFTGPDFAGGMVLVSMVDPKVKLVTPNLTPDPETGRIASWNEELFVARFRTGRGAEGTHMPWQSFSRMTDDDLRSLWRFLSTRAPVRHDTGASVQPPPVASGPGSRQGGG